jgi:hypothetical protein
LGVDRSRPKWAAARGLGDTRRGKIALRSLAERGIYATGGAREGRCSEKVPFDTICCGIELKRVTGDGVSARSKCAAASAGICSAWQIWHGVSWPLVCSCRNAPPLAKYKSAAHASRANPFRKRLSSSVRREMDMSKKRSKVGSRGYTLPCHLRRTIPAFGFVGFRAAAKLRSPAISVTACTYLYLLTTPLVQA